MPKTARKTSTMSPKCPPTIKMFATPSKAKKHVFVRIHLDLDP